MLDYTEASTTVSYNTSAYDEHAECACCKTTAGQVQAMSNVPEALYLNLKARVSDNAAPCCRLS